MKKTYKKISVALVAIISVVAITISSSITIVATESENYLNDGLENCHQLDQYEVDEGYILQNKYNSSSLRAVTLPEYTANTYFTDNGYECTDHGTIDGVYVNPCKPGRICNCREFESSIQCAGFARYVYTTHHGYSIDSVSKTNLDRNISSGDIAKATLKDLPEGTFIKVNARTTSGGTIPHFMIVSATSENDVLLYHANYGGSCRVRNMRITYDVFATNFPYIYYTC